MIKVTESHCLFLGHEPICMQPSEPIPASPVIARTGFWNPTGFSAFFDPVASFQAIFVILPMSGRWTIFVSLFAISLALWGKPLWAQPAYWAGTEQVFLTEDRQRLLVFLDTPGLGPEAFDTLGWGVSHLQGAGSSPLSDHWLIHFHTSSSLPAEQLAQALLADPDHLRGATYGHRLPDGLPVLLTHRILFHPAPTYDATAFRVVWSTFGGVEQGQTATGIHWIRTADLAQVLPLCQALQGSGLVRWAHPDFLVEPTPASDPLYGQQFYLHNTGQLVDGQAGVADMDIDAPEAWGYTTGSPLLKVAIMDNGLAPHEDLNDALGQSRILPGYDIMDPLNGTGAPATNDECHGQGIAGLLSASHNALGIRGVAPEVKLLPVYMPFSPLNPLSAMADGLNWAWQNGADVMCNAWTYYTCLANPFPVLTQAIDDGRTQGRGGLGTTYVFAAGNNSSCVGFPSSLPGVLAVGAITHTGQVAPYANTGAALDLVAPTSGAVDNVRTLDRMGPDGVNTNGVGDLPNLHYTRLFGGTSTATALTAGGAALVLSAFSYLTEAEVRNLLTQSATDMGALGWDDSTGHGRLNLYDALTLGNTLYALPYSEVEGEKVAGESRLVWLQQPPQGLLVHGLPTTSQAWQAVLVDSRGVALARRQAPASADGRWLWSLDPLPAGLYVLRLQTPGLPAFTLRFRVDGTWR
ncbi:MAG: hypothetical protein D6722_12565 [Bacteroidetes bacterium]|nr:MAG: hypothetical protein D6722_12565 [Bacteroidota bacterium]